MCKFDDPVVYLNQYSNSQASNGSKLKPNHNNIISMDPINTRQIEVKKAKVEQFLETSYTRRENKF